MMRIELLLLNRPHRVYCLILICLFSLSAGACSIFINSDFNQASTIDTAEAYQQFLEKYQDKDNKYTHQAEVRLEALSYKAAFQKNTYISYVDFIKQFPYGKYTKHAERRAEELQAANLGIHLYRAQPQDFYTWVDTHKLPFRVQILSFNPEMQESDRINKKWYDQLLRRDLFVPMAPGEISPILPDLTLYIRESMITLCIYPLTLVEAELRAGEKVIKTYRIAGERIEKYLLYEIFKDREVYESLLQIPEHIIKGVNERFSSIKNTLPREGSLALEFELRQQASKWDRQMILDFVHFLKQQSLYQEFCAYPRGHPPQHSHDHRIYLSVNPHTHQPQLHRQWNSVGPSVDWSEMNAKRVIEEKDYFFKKMAIDLLDLLSTPLPY